MGIAERMLAGMTSEERERALAPSISSIKSCHTPKGVRNRNVRAAAGMGIGPEDLNEERNPSGECFSSLEEKTRGRIMKEGRVKQVAWAAGTFLVSGGGVFAVFFYRGSPVFVCWVLALVLGAIFGCIVFTLNEPQE